MNYFSINIRKLCDRNENFVHRIIDYVNRWYFRNELIIFERNAKLNRNTIWNFTHTNTYTHTNWTHSYPDIWVHLGGWLWHFFNSRGVVEGLLQRTVQWVNCTARVPLYSPSLCGYREPCNGTGGGIRGKKLLRSKGLRIRVVASTTNLGCLAPMHFGIVDVLDALMKTFSSVLCNQCAALICSLFSVVFFLYFYCWNDGKCLFDLFEMKIEFGTCNFYVSVWLCRFCNVCIGEAISAKRPE